MALRVETAQKSEKNELSIIFSLSAPYFVLSCSYIVPSISLPHASSLLTWREWWLDFSFDVLLQVKLTYTRTGWHKLHLKVLDFKLMCWGEWNLSKATLFRLLHFHFHCHLLLSLGLLLTIPILDDATASRLSRGYPSEDKIHRKVLEKTTVERWI